MQKLFSYPLQIDDMGNGIKTYYLKANKEQLKYIAEALKLDDVLRFEARVDVLFKYKTHKIDVTGNVVADVEHTSVVSLDKFVKNYSTDFAMQFDTEITQEQIKDLDLEFDDDVPDPVENGQIDLADIAMEQLALILEDFPRKEGEIFKFESEFDEETTKKVQTTAAKAYKTKAGAQDAHVAIRPTMPEIAPEKLKESLTPEQYKLYKLVWDRFIASQMAAALYDTVSIDINAGDYTFKASGFSVRFDGFSVLYPYGDEEKSSIPKHANSGDVLKVREIKPNQHFTAPPSRYSEASLIKALEENGIGRPSTYAPIITTIISRNYVEKDGKALKPTALGTVTVDLITEHFSNIVDVDFTAKMEKDLDKVENGKTDWVHMMKKFYEDFQKSLELAQKNQGAEKIQVPEEETDVICEKCGRKMVVKTGRFGKFLACPGYPACQNTKRIVKETGGECPLCGARILSKKSKTGKTYYGCEHNPTCGFMSWDEPTAEKCPDCGKEIKVFGENGLQRRKVRIEVEG